LVCGPRPVARACFGRRVCTGKSFLSLLEPPAGGIVCKGNSRRPPPALTDTGPMSACHLIRDSSRTAQAFYRDVRARRAPIAATFRPARSSQPPTRGPLWTCDSALHSQRRCHNGPAGPSLRVVCPLRRCSRSLCGPPPAADCPIPGASSGFCIAANRDATRGSAWTRPEGASFAASCAAPSLSQPWTLPRRRACRV